MNTQSFSIFKAIDFGFRMFGRNFWLLLGLSLLGAAVQFGGDIVSTMIFMQSNLSTCQRPEEEEFKSSAVVKVTHSLDRAFKDLLTQYVKVQDCYKKNILPFMVLIFVKLLAAIFAYVLLMGWNRIALDLYDIGRSKFSRIFIVIPLFFSYLMAGILYAAIITGGFILLIIPGIIWAIKYSFFDLIIIDTGCGPIEALRRSGQLTYGHKWRLFLFALFSMFLIAITAVTIIVPFILTYVFFLSRAYIYRTLQEIKKSDHNG